MSFKVGDLVKPKYPKSRFNSFIYLHHVGVCLKVFHHIKFGEQIQVYWFMYGNEDLRDGRVFDWFSNDLCLYEVK